ncbi:MAG: signal peptide peptidase SppA [bacterium]
MDTPQQFSQFDNYTYPKRRKVWPWVLLVIGIIIIGFIGLFFAIIGGISSSFSSAFEQEKVTVEPKTVLMMDLSNVSEVNSTAPFAFLGNENPSYFEITQAIENAAKDKNITGIYYKASMVPLDPAHAEGIKRAIEKFKKSGKFVYAFIEVGDETQYINALSADSIFMPQEGILELNGYSASSLFFKDFLQKIGMKYEVIQFEDFKSYGESYSRTNFSDSAKLALRVLLNQRMDYLVTSIAERRKMSIEKIKADLDKGIFSAEEALQGGYIDKIISATDMRDFLKKKSGAKKLEMMSLNKYASQVDNEGNGKVDEKKTIAIVNAVGAINSGTGGGAPYNASQGIYSGSFVKMLRKVREDKDIKAVIIRISSPGGSVMASDEIYSEIEKLRSIKPVYASMADVAASGGYYIALPCDSIFAQNQTITGSIGVISVIPNFSGTIKLLGISNDTINTTKSSGQLNLFKAFNPVDIARFKSYSSDVYKRFVMKTAKNRKMSFDQARALAKGRVWTGADAQKRGLIDGIADLSQVIEIVKKRLGVPEGTKVPLDIYPAKGDQLSDFLKGFGIDKSGDDDEQQELSIKSILGITDAKFELIKENLPKEMQSQVMYMLDLTKMGQKEKVLMAMPAMLNVK